MFDLPVYPRIKFKYNLSNKIFILNKNYVNKGYVENVTSTRLIDCFRKPIDSWDRSIYVLTKYEDIKIAFSKGYLGVYLDNGNINFKCLILKKEHNNQTNSIIVDKNFYDLLKTKRKNRTLGERFLEKCFNDIINLAIINNIEIIFQENIYLLNSGIDKLPNFVSLKEKKSFEESLYIGCQDLIVINP
jgi:hypothetical protein